MRPFVHEDISDEVLRDVVQRAYGVFEHPDVAPLRPLGENRWCLELFHGPTLAFKDIALQLIGQLFDHALQSRKQRTTILGATSGDTGSAAIAGCRGRDALDIFILHPHGRVSAVQRRQMTTVQDRNVHNIALQGTFDDCQRLVKALFSDPACRNDLQLSSINSINWARVMAQIVYYFVAALALGAPRTPVSFAVPTGNFGNIFAGYIAHQMGLPIAQLVLATNKNNILKRMMDTGEYRVAAVHSTLSPSMDIQVASNFERLLFDVAGQDATVVNAAMASLQSCGSFRIPNSLMREIRALFSAHSTTDAQTTAVICDVYQRTGVLLDPHTAVGFDAAAQVGHDDTPMVILGTAHPAKFPQSVQEATGVFPSLPAHLSDLHQREEHYVVLPDEVGVVESFIRSHVRGCDTIQV